MTLYHTPLADLRAEALRLTCTCGSTGLKHMDGIIEGMPPGATLADLARLPCGQCSPAGRVASIGIVGAPPPEPDPEIAF